MAYWPKGTRKVALAVRSYHYAIRATGNGFYLAAMPYTRGVNSRDASQARQHLRWTPERSKARWVAHGTAKRALAILGQLGIEAVEVVSIKD